MAAAKLSTVTPAVLAIGSVPSHAQQDEIPCFLPQDKAFEKNTELFLREVNVTPSGIVRPRTALEVAQVVRSANANNVPFTVRTGGFDHWARCFSEGVLCIDMRSLDTVTVSSDKKTATLGGGVLTGKVIGDLAEHDLATTCAIKHGIGYVGWASMGGWGSFNNHFGYGADQIIGATVVNFEGEIVPADEATLNGIRGGGASNFGVIVDITVKVYELQKMLAGTIVLDSSNGIGETFTRFASAMQHLRDESVLPAEVAVAPFVATLPNQGTSVCVSFTSSSSDLAFGNSCLEQVLAVSPVAFSDVREMSVSQWASSSLTGDSLPSGQWGAVLAVSVSNWSPRVLEVMRQVAADMPADAGAAIYVHSIGPQSPSIQGSLDKASSISPELRQSHFMIELAGVTLEQAKRDQVSTWAHEGYRALRECDEALSTAQPSLLDIKDQVPEAMFGSKLQGLRDLNAACDPHALCKSGLPRLW